LRISGGHLEGVMEDRIVRLESRVAYLHDHVTDLEQRLANLEGRAPARVDEPHDRDALAVISGIERAPVQQWLALVGRTLVVLGGAYLLRALTGSHVLSAQAGVGFGILYGAPWLLLASREAARGSQVDAFAHALTAALIGYPLVWEATLRFNVISPEQSAALLGGLTAAALVLSSMRNLQGLAWVVTFGALLSAVGLAIATGSWTAYTVLTIGVGLATLWLGYTRDWTMLRWPAAATANLMLLIVSGRAAGAGGVRAALMVQMLMLAGYLGSFAVRTLFIGRQVIPFEVAQSVAVLAVAFGGAISLVRSTGSNVVLIGVVSLLLGAGGYVVAFSFVERHRHVKNFFFYTLLAQLFAIVGIGLCMGYGGGSFVYSTVAVVCAAVATRSHRLTLALQATIYAIAAALGSGLVAAAARGLAGPASGGWSAITLASVLALAALAIVTFLPVRRPVESWGIFASIPRVVLLTVFVSTAVGVAVLTAAAMLDGEHVDGSVLATIRTAILVIATLALAGAARLPGGREAGWLVYPLIIVIGMKLLVADFPQGRPETLFAALGLYGFALIAAPRMLRRMPTSPARTVAALDRGQPSRAAPAGMTAGTGHK
jgi:hypothetical protein